MKILCGTCLNSCTCLVFHMKPSHCSCTNVLVTFFQTLSKTFSKLCTTDWALEILKNQGLTSFIIKTRYAKFYNMFDSTHGHHPPHMPHVQDGFWPPTIPMIYNGKRDGWQPGFLRFLRSSLYQALFFNWLVSDLLFFLLYLVFTFFVRFLQ